MPKLYAALADLVALDPDPDAQPPRLPVLERLLSRAERRPASPDWRRWALACAGGEAPPGDLPLARALAVRHGLTPLASETWLLATPVHLVASLSQLRLHHAGALTLAPGVALRLAARHAAEWADPTLSLVAVGDSLLLRVDGLLAFESRDPDLWAGREVGAALPVGADAGRLRRLITELQMWLHDAAPLASNGLAINALWLWGGGHSPIAQPPAWPTLTSLDAGVAALAADATRLPDAELVSYRVADLAERALDFADADVEWFAPLAARLAAGRLEDCRVHMGRHEFRLRAWQRWRVWVPSRPWWELAA